MGLLSELNKQYMVEINKSGGYMTLDAAKKRAEEEEHRENIRVMQEVMREKEEAAQRQAHIEEVHKHAKIWLKAVRSKADESRKMFTWVSKQEGQLQTEYKVLCSYEKQIVEEHGREVYIAVEKAVLEGREI